MFNEHKTNILSYKYKDKHINLCDALLKNNPKNVLEIGFNSGFSTLLMLMTNPNVNITCVDLGEHSYRQPCLEWLLTQFPNRIQYFEGDSREILPKLIETKIHMILFISTWDIQMILYFIIFKIL